VVDPEVTNNSASTDLSLAVWAEADLKITSQSLVDPPSEIPANQDVVITLRKDIHNNGPYGPLDVSVVSSATASAACTVTPATQDFVLNAVPVSTAQVLDETWTINCSEVGAHVFTFANSISATAEHVEGSDSASTELRVTVPPVILPTAVPPTPTVTPPVLPTALPPTGGSGLTQLTTGWQALVFLGGAMALMLAGMGSAMWSLRRRSK
jgi:hypothetical protein